MVPRVTQTSNISLFSKRVHPRSWDKASPWDFQYYPIQRLWLGVVRSLSSKAWVFGDEGIKSILLLDYRFCGWFTSSYLFCLMLVLPWKRRTPMWADVDTSESSHNRLFSIQVPQNRGKQNNDTVTTVVRTAPWIKPCSCISFCYSSPSESGWNGSSSRYDCGRFVVFLLLFIMSSNSYSRRYRIWCWYV